MGNFPGAANDFRVNYSRAAAKSSFLLDSFGGAVPLSTIPFPPGHDTHNGLFFFQVSSLGVGQTLDVGQSSQNVQRQVNLVDGISLQKGSHSLKFGVDFRRLSPENAVFGGYEQGARFSTVAAAESGKSLIGLVQVRNNTTLLFHNLGIYAQDTWRVSRRLTTTFGLRWDVDFAPSSQEGGSIPSLSGYNLQDLSLLVIAPKGTAPFKTPYGNVAPRIGAAYQISQTQGWQTVFRGGFGVFYDLASAETGGLINSTSPPFGALSVFRNATFPFTSAQIAPLTISPTATLASFAAFNPNLKLPYTLEWNASVEQAIGRDQILTASYVGAIGKRLLQSTFLIGPPSNPNIGQGIITDNTASSNYNALQVQFQRRLSHGLQALASYTFSHSIDDASAGSVGSSSNLSIPGSPGLNRGNSDFDVRHAFSTGFTYDIPSPRGNLLTRAVLGGWSTENVIFLRSAAPLDLTDEDFFVFDSGVEANIRPDVVAAQPLYLYGANCASVMQALGNLAPGQSCPGGKGLNPGAFADPPVNPTTGNPSRQGTLGRNVLRGFGVAQWDFAVHRDFTIHEGLKLQFRAEMFSVLNRPNFGPPSGEYLSSASGGPAGFGLSTQTYGQSLTGSGGLGGGAFNPLYQIGGPRSVQLALKLMF